MEKLRMFVAQEPVVAASCLIAGFGTLSLSELSQKPYLIWDQMDGIWMPKLRH